MNEAINLPQCVREISKHIGEDLSTWTSVLFGEAAFIQIYEHPDALVEQAAGIYSDPNETYVHKEITGYAMQRLPVDKYVWLVSHVMLLVEQERIPPRLLGRLAFPELNWRPNLSLYWDKPEVKALLLRLADCKPLGDDRRADIKNRILTGKAREQYLDLKEAGQLK